jgi:hypothetical protein
MLLERPLVDPAALHAATGWKLEPQGLCRDERCVPLPDDARRAGGIDAAELARRLGMELVADDAHGLWDLGPEAGGRALTSARLPDLDLPDRHGRPFSLRSLRGTRFVMVAWASW